MLDFGVQADNLLPYVVESIGLTAKDGVKLMERVWAFSSKVRQPRRDDRSCNKTPFFDRWDINADTSYLTAIDPRYATRPECELVAATLLALLLEAQGASPPSNEAVTLAGNTLGRSIHPETLVCVHTQQPITAEDIKRALLVA